MSRILCLSIVFFVLFRLGAASSICPRLEFSFLEDDGLTQQCPLWIEPSPPIQVSGEILDLLGHDGGYTIFSVLFYASWCPFSRNVRPIFSALSSMFPQINHLEVEESTALPSVFSRYSIRSFPSMLLVKGRMRVLYYGPKDLNSLKEFYKEITGLEPVAYLDMDQTSREGLRASSPWSGSLKEIISREPYLVFGLCFLCLRILICFLPKIFHCAKALCAMYFWHYMKFDFVTESTKLLEHVLHVMDFRKLWSQVKLCNKTMNFKQGAKNAGVWASPLASVALGESSSRTSAE